jgi:hypothetical protein
MPTVPAIDLAKLLKDIPRGAWVAISADHERVITYGSEARQVLKSAQELGEKNPILVRVPESSTVLMM